MTPPLQVALGAETGRGPVRQDVDFTTVFPPQRSNLGHFLNGAVDALADTPGLDAERFLVLFEATDVEDAPALLAFFLGGMGGPIDDRGSSAAELIHSLHELDLEQIATGIRAAWNLAGDVIDALPLAYSLVKDPRYAGEMREIGKAVGAAGGADIFRSTESPSHAVQRLGEVWGTIWVEVLTSAFLGAVTAGAGVAIRGSRYGAAAFSTVEKLVERVAPGFMRRARTLAATSDRGTAERGTADRGTARRGTDATRPTSQAAGTGRLMGDSGAVPVEGVDVPELGRKRKSGPLRESEPPPARGHTPARDKVRGVPVPQLSGSRDKGELRVSDGPPARAHDAKRRRSEEGRKATDDETIEQELFGPRLGRKPRDNPPTMVGFGMALLTLTRWIHSAAGAATAAPRQFKKLQRNKRGELKQRRREETEWSKNHEQYTKQLGRLEAEFRGVMPEARQLDPASEDDMRILRKVVDVLEAAYPIATARYNAMRNRIWRHAWDDPDLRIKLLTPAAKDAKFTDRIGQRTLDQIWDDHQLRNDILHDHWGLMWWTRGRPPLSRVSRVDEAGRIVHNWKSLNLDHTVRRADQPFLAIDHKNLQVTTAIENQQALEAIRLHERSTYSRRGLSPTGPLSELQGGNERISKSILLNKHLIRAERERRGLSADRDGRVDDPVAGEEQDRIRDFQARKAKEESK